MSFDIRIDYRFDATGFFDAPERRAALEHAVAIWEGILEDEFDDVPAGIAFEIDDPSASGTARRVVLDRPIDDLLIFVGAERLAGPLALGGFDGTGDTGQGLGDAYAARVSDDFRSGGPVTDFEPWAGTVTYDLDADWSFSVDAPVAGKTDFVSVTLHEIGHVLGFGTAPIHDRIAANGFDGPNALSANGGDPIPMEGDLGHVERGFAMESVLMGPSLTNGTRLLPSEIDKAMLADIGWEIDGFAAQGATPAIATEAGETIFGSDLPDAIDGLGGDDQVQGRGGDDVLTGGAGDDMVFGGIGADVLDGGAGADTLFGGIGADTLAGGAGDDQVQGGTGDDLIIGGAGADVAFGQDGTDRFRMIAGGGALSIQDFDPGAEVIELVGSGFASAAAALAAVEKPFGNVSRLTFGDGTRVDVFHAGQPGTPLSAANLSVADPDGPATIAGGPGPDDLTGGAAAEVLLGRAGDDTLDGGGGDDTVEGGAGDDRLRGGDGDDALRGGAGADTLFGQGGADTLRGGAGDDTYVLDGPRHRVEEAAGAGRDAVVSGGDVVLGAAEIEAVTLTGTARARVTGNGVATEITGNAAANVLIGGGGGDTLAGGGGDDVFVFLLGDLGTGAGRVADFSGGDAIALDDRLFGPGDGAVDPRAVTQAQVRAALEGGRALYDGRTGELRVDPDGRRGPADPELLLVIEGGVPIFAEDLLLF